MSEDSDHDGAEETKKFQDNIKRKKLNSCLVIESDSESEGVLAPVHSTSLENVEDRSGSSEDEDDEESDSEDDEVSEGDEEDCESSEGEGSSNSGWDTQSESGSSDEEGDDKEKEANDGNTNSAPPAAIKDYSSDSSDGTSDKCPICLLRFTDQEVGTPESCDHSFCADCLQEWSKTVNTCPVDRQEFSLILVRRRVEGKVIRKVPVEVKAKDEEPPEDPTYCEVCGNCDREDRMLLCDGCDLGFHLECLSPPLEHVPIEEWYCPECAPTEARRPRLDSTTMNEVDLEDEPLMLRSHRATRQRVLPRTLQMERIRVQVVSAVVQRRSDDYNQPSTSVGADSDEDAGPSKTRRTSKVIRKRKRRYAKRKTCKKKKSTIKKRKTTSSKTTKTSKSTTGKRKKISKRKTGKRKKRKVSTRPRRATRTARVAIPQSVRGRLAEQLGMRPLRQPWQTLPEVRSTSSASAPVNNINFQRFRAGIPTLHLFGQRDQLDYFSGSDDEHRDMEGGGDTAVAATARPALSIEHRLSNRKRLLAALHRPTASKSKLPSIQPAGDCDIVGSILSSQSKWLSAKKTDVVINRDGSLDFKTKKAPPTKMPTTQTPPAQPPDPLERLQESRVDVNDASSTEKHIARAPLYPNSGGGGGPRRGGGGMNNFSFRGRQSGGGAVGTFPVASGSNFQSPFSGSSGFGPENTRAQYEHFLGNNAQNNPQPRNPPLRFRLNNPRVQLRRNANLLNRRQTEQNNGRCADDGARTQRAKEEEDDVDIYSDIEPDSAGKEGSEQEEGGEREYGTLMPPPEPPALLMAGFADVGSDDDASDSELVIDDRWATSPKSKQADAAKEDKYDPADPSHDSDNEDNMAILADDIPLPPDKPPEVKIPDTTTNDTEETEAPKSNESEKVDEDGMKEDEKEESEKVEEDAASNGPTAEEPNQCDKHPSPEKDAVVAEEKLEVVAEKEPIDENMDNAEKAEESSESEDGDCPNFSIYSADTMEIARRTGEEDDAGKEAVKEDVEEKKDEDGKEETKEDEQGKGEAAVSCVEKKDGTDSPAPDSRSKVDDEVESEAEVEAEAETRKEGLLEVNVEKEEVRALSEGVREEEESDDEGEEPQKRRRASSNSDEDGPADSTEKIPLKKRHDDEEKGKDAQHLVDEIFGSDDDSLVGGATSAVSTGTLENVPMASVVPGLEGLETETISETEEAINFDDMSDGEEYGRKRKKKRSSGEDGAKRDSPSTRPSDSGEFEEGEILDESQRGDSSREHIKKDRTEKESVADENVDTSKAKSSPSADDEKRRKKKKASSKERAVVSSSENKSKAKDKSSKEDISWKKPSKSTRDRNYRDGKDKKDDREERENSRSRKKKEKRKDLERYDVRKVLSDKTLSKQNKDAFGRDIDRRRSLTRSKSRGRTPRRSRSRSRSRARSSSRTRVRGRRPSRGRSRSRSRHRSPLRSKDRPRRSRSKDKKKRSSRERDRSKRSRSKNRSGSRARNRSRASPLRSRSRSPVRKRREVREREQAAGRVRASWSRSPSRSWSPSLTGSPQYPVNQAVGRRHDRTLMRSLSRSWSREPVERPNNVPATGKRRKNLTVIVTNSKEEMRRRRREQSRRNLRRRPSPVPSKEVFASGDNILVSVNFKSNKSGGAAAGSTAAKDARKKRDETRAKRPRKDKQQKNDTQAAPEKAPTDKRKKTLPPEASQKPVAIIDLEQSPFREYTPSPKDVIVLSDSEEDLNQKTVEELEQMHHHITDSEGLNISGLTSSLDEGQLQSSGHSGVSSYLMTSTGPKTPPEPQIKFSISGKQQLRTITNPLMDHEDEEEDVEDETTQNDVDMMTHKGPNTPPESPLGPATPASPTTSPDAYDPFDPTKSRSPSPDQGATGANSSGTPRVDGDAENGVVTIDEAVPKSAADASDDAKTSPQRAAEADTATKKSPLKTSPGVLPEVSRMLDSLDDVEKKSPGSSADATSTTVAGKVAVSSAGSTEVTSTSSSRANVFNAVASTNTSASQRILASSMKVRPATKTNLPLPKIVPLRQNGDPAQPTDVVDMDLDSSPYSPAPSEGDDLFEPPPNYSSSRTKTSAPPPRAQKSCAGTKDKFDNLFGSSPRVSNKYSPWSKNAATSKVSSKHAAKMNKLVSKHIAKLRKADPGGAGGKMDEDQLKILDEVPSSAVEMQVKDKFLKKLNRQERVVEEVKLALKPHYYKKIINKEDYKEILRRSVPKICHNRSGEINPIKIRGLVEAYVKKVRYLKKKAAGQLGKAKTGGATIASMALTQQRKLQWR